MPRCDTCGNDYHDPIEVTKAGKRYTFDSFECAIHKLAPKCSHCGCRVIGHGVEEGDKVFCCQHCLDATLGIGHAPEVPVRREL